MRLDELNRAIDLLGAIPLVGVTEHSEGYPVDLVREATSGKLTIRATNEGGNNYTFVDVFQLIEWLQLGPIDGRTDDGDFVLRG